ncbi:MULTISPECIES: class I SAM-dependent methyltransferase [unclassified Leifsonia]|uniref:class I SAM-dependent methyltransferase n=1 Tax=unclassified Leifsonia TaxID=2663824 RepID=UPI0006F3E8C4|nr:MULTISPECIES: class I SAM-dependent methyltransferase [unclassified Leifsonia]KQX05027.1 SAM-dependent methyltransferase [Leifsonia sp. Root1293]KRA08659.1 SAM-dependent methyltransferase [Leifsonia sp. Root60]
MFEFESLRRFPDVEAPNLFASDAADRLIIDEAGPALLDAAPGSVVVIGDDYGALTLGAAALYEVTGIRTHQDDLSGELALANNATAADLADVYSAHGLDEQLLSGASIVLLRLPRGLDALDEIAEAIARFAEPDVRVVAGGRLKHMTPAQNDVLLRHFGRVDVSLARQKSRVLLATELRRSAEGTPPAPPRWPRRSHDDALDLEIVAHAAAFAGASVDMGTRMLLGHLGQAAPDATSVIDLGCGTGVLGTALALRRPEIRVIATDQSSAAVASTRETAEANGVADRVSVVRDDGLSRQADASAEFIVLNPPFHIGATVHTGLAHKLFADAGRVLAPGGELWTVWNTHLGYRSALTSLVGPTRQVARNDKFTVTVSTRL